MALTPLPNLRNSNVSMTERSVLCWVFALSNIQMAGLKGKEQSFFPTLIEPSLQKQSSNGESMKRYKRLKPMKKMLKNEEDGLLVQDKVEMFMNMMIWRLSKEYPKRRRNYYNLLGSLE